MRSKQTLLPQELAALFPEDIEFSGEVSLTKDPVTLGQLRDLPKTGMWNQTAAKKAKRAPHVDMDQININ